jgi:ATP-dependent Clp endopeptidase proteolytic subunit ClpP
MDRAPTKAEEKKTLAEAERAEAEAENWRAQTSKLAIEEEEARADSRTAEARADMMGLELRKQLHSDRAWQANDIFNHRYTFDTQVNLNTVNTCLDVLKFWEKNDDTPGEIEFVIVSPGGDIYAGLYLFDYIQTMRRKGWKFTTIAYGIAASMGGILLQAGDVRAMAAESLLLIHEASTWTAGKPGEIEDDMERIKKWQERIVDLFVKRSGGKITATKFKAGWKRKDWWLTSDEALALGLIDEIR